MQQCLLASTQTNFYISQRLNIFSATVAREKTQLISYSKLKCEML